MFIKTYLFQQNLWVYCLSLTTQYISFLSSPLAFFLPVVLSHSYLYLLVYFGGTTTAFACRTDDRPCWMPIRINGSQIRNRTRGFPNTKQDCVVTLDDGHYGKGIRQTPVCCTGQLETDFAKLNTTMTKIHPSYFHFVLLSWRAKI